MAALDSESLDSYTKFKTFLLQWSSPPMQIADLSIALGQVDDIAEVLDLGTGQMTCELVRVAAQGTRQLPPSPGRERLVLALEGCATLISEQTRQTLASGLLVGLTDGSALELQCEGTQPFEALLVTSTPSSEVP